MLATFHDNLPAFSFFTPDFFKETATVALQFAKKILTLSVICFFLELMQPERYPISIRARLRGLYFMLIYFGVASYISLCFSRAIHLADYPPLLFLKLQWFADSKNSYLHSLGMFAAAFVSLAIFDFFYYAFHRLQHKIPFLWHFHSIHHLPRELSVWSNYHHFTEEIFRYIFLLLPVTLLIQTTPVPLIFIFIISLQGIYNHSATRFSFGYLRYFLLDTRYHRIHHSIEKQHWNKNFASLFPLWDIVFRTAYFPKAQEWPATGLVGEEETKGVAEYLMRPFQKLWKK